MATSKNKTADGRRRNKHSLFANTYEAEMPWKPRDVVRRRSRVPRQEIGKQLGKMRQLRSFTSWREMKKALDNSLSSNTEIVDVTDDEEEASSSTDDRSLTVRLEPARLSLPPEFQTRRPMEKSPLTLLFFKEEGGTEEHPERLQKQPETTFTYTKLLKRVITVTFVGQNGQKITRLMFSDCQWHQLQDQMTQKQYEKEEKERKAMELLRRKQLSMEMAKTWDNTYVNMRKIRYEKRKERLKKEKEYKDKVFRQLQEENEILKNKIRDKAQDVAFYDQDCTKTFHSAFRLSEVQAERQAQLEFNEKLKKIEKEIEIKYAQSIMDDAKRFKEEQEEEKRQLIELKKKLGFQARVSYAEVEKAKRAEKEQRNKEDKEDMEIMKRQLEQVIENEKNETLRKKEMIRISLIENRELVEKNKKLAKLEEEEENKAIKIIANGKMRIAKIRKEKEEQMMEEKRNRFKTLSSNIAQEKQAKLEKEEESYKRAVEELEKRENDAMEKNRQYQEMLRNERIQTHLEDMKREEERLEKERELLKWEILRRFKREELNNKFSEKIKEEKRKKGSYYKNIFKEQIESDIDRQVKEKEIELQAAKKAQENWDMSDKQFLEYAYKVREESKNKGRPLYPLDAAIYEFKKKNQLLKNVRNFIYDAKIDRPEGIKDYKYEEVLNDNELCQPRPTLKNNQSNGSVRKGCGCSQNRFNVLEREECGCSKKANGL